MIFDIWIKFELYYKANFIYIDLKINNYGILWWNIFRNDKKRRKRIKDNILNRLEMEWYISKYLFFFFFYFVKHLFIVICGFTRYIYYVRFILKGFFFIIFFLVYRFY